MCCACSYVAGDLDTSDKHTHSSNKYLIIKHILFGAQCVDRLSKWEEDFVVISSLLRAWVYLTYLVRRQSRIES